MRLPMGGRRQASSPVERRPGSRTLRIPVSLLFAPRGGILFFFFPFLQPGTIACGRLLCILDFVPERRENPRPLPHTLHLLRPRRVSRPPTPHIHMSHEP